MGGKRGAGVSRAVDAFEMMMAFFLLQWSRVVLASKAFSSVRFKAIKSVALTLHVA